MDEPGFKLSEANVAIIGLGLMGGSMAMALHGQCRQLSGLDTDADVRDLAQRMGVVDTVSDDAHAVLADADLVVLACPVPAILTWLERLPEFVKKPCVVLDLGSSKRTILAAMQDLPSNFDPIGAHPICGKETLSLRSAERDLYCGERFVVIPLQRSGSNAKQAAQQLVDALEARLLLEDAASHDAALAATSHIPYLISSALALATAPETGRFVGPGFRSTARLAGTPASMMLGVLETNRDQVLAQLKDFTAALGQMEQALERDDLPALQSLLDSAQARYQTLL
ncbi:MAG: prephenate dehydrogenase [Chloroflexota bacterium]|nr:prephenate dehydrogenase [Chloroflexota bacterium]